MSDIPHRLAKQVMERADNRCEYCQLSQLGQEATFHIDHVVPRSENGQTQLDNLALACVSCSLRKWAKQTAIDPQSGQLTPLFNPRTEKWIDHFQWQGEHLIPLSAIGRTTVNALALNRSLILAIRLEEVQRGRHPYEPKSCSDS